MMSSHLELLEAQISEGQRALQELHAAKRRIQATERRQLIEQEVRGVQDQGLPVVAVTEQDLVSQAPTLADFPTSKGSVDLTRSETVQLQQSFPPRMEQNPLHPNQPLSRDEMFLQGAIPSLSGTRGPQKVVLFPRNRT